MKLHIRHLTVVASLSLALVACGRSAQDARTGGAPATSGPSLVSLDGSSTVFPISEAVAEEFQKVEKDTRVTVGISGTGGGFQKFCRAEIDIADASRPISASEIAAC
jgi:phosphate transport system substrate-binding protein